MEKKDIYEHLAKIYLDASLKRKKKTREYSKVFRNLFFVSIALAIVLSGALFSSFSKRGLFRSETALILLPDVVKINFHFDPAKKETYSVSLNKLNLSKYKSLGFAAKKINYKDPIAIKIEFISAFKEKSEFYIKDIAPQWKNYKISLSEFKNISSWQGMLSLTFIVEEWNVEEKRGVVYLDNVRFLK